MNFKALLSILSSTSAISFGMIAPAIAEVPSAAIEEIIVNARRVEERLQDVPISISVFNQQQLEDRNIVTASDLATYTPSLTVNSRFGPDKSAFAIRGFSQDGITAPTVGVYFAEVVAPRAASGTSGGNGSGPGSFFDLQNVQILKGPQGTLFGRNTTGGAILLVPTKPTDRFEGYVEGSVGNYDLGRAQAVVNVPIADTFRVRFGVDHQGRDGYLHNKSGIGPDNFGDVDYTAVRASLVADLAPNLENYTIASYSKSETNGTALRLIACKRDPATRTGLAAITAALGCAQIDRQDARGDGYYDVENSVTDPYANVEQWQFINTTTWTASDALTAKNIVSYAQYHERLHTDIGGDNFFVLSGPNTGQHIDYIEIYNAPNADSNSETTFSEELQFSGQSFGSRLKWQAGGYLEISSPIGDGSTTYSQVALNCPNGYAYQCTSYFGAVGGLGLVYNKIGYRNLGLYGQGTYELSDQFAITAGIRYTSDRTKGQAGRETLGFPTPNVPTASCANPARHPTSTTSNFNPHDCDSGLIIQQSSRPTWLIDLEYRPIQDTMLYAKYSRGYRQGGVNATIIGLSTWAPEKVDNYEIGAKTTFHGFVRGYFNVAGFYNDFTNQQLTAAALAKPTSGLSGAAVVVNAGKSRISGIEADSSITLVEHVKLDLGYAYLSTKLQQFVTPTLPADSPYASIVAPLVGGDLPLSPHHRVTATGTYTLPLNDQIGRVSLGITYIYTSSQVANSSSPYGVLPPSNLVNLNVNWEAIAGSPIDVNFFVTNLTKEKFPVNLSGNWTSAGFESIVPNLPQMWGIRLKYRFGQSK